MFVPGPPASRSTSAPTQTTSTTDTDQFIRPPRPLTPLIGRQHELATVSDLLLRPDVRLVTMVGPGGVGKTRLALELAVTLADAFDDGVAFVQFASIADPALMLSTIARAVGLRESRSRTVLDSLLAFLADRQLLIICDNVEKVVERADDLVPMLSACPQVRLLATSLAPLQLPAERVVPLQPLRTPDPAVLASLDDLRSYGAIRLFTDRAMAANPDFRLTDENARDVAEMCRRLDGIPLALELAAARLKMMSPSALLARFDDRLAVLTRGSRDRPARHQTMRDTIAWSYDLLSSSDQQLFRRVSVFSGGFTLAAAEMVCQGRDGQTDRRTDGQNEKSVPGSLSPVPSVVDGIDSLVAKSLVHVSEWEGADAAVGPRYAMFETIREFGQERLAKEGGEEANAIRRAHASWYLGLVESVEPHLHGPDQHRWGRLLESEHGNLRAALAWLIQIGDATMSLLLAAQLVNFWWFAGHIREGYDWLKRAFALDADVPDTVRAKALDGAGFLARVQGDAEGAVALLEQSLALYRASDNRPGIASALYNLGVGAEDRGAYDRSAAFFTESAAVAASLGDTRGEAFALLHLGIVAYGEGDFEAATRYSNAGIALARELDSRFGVVLGNFCLALIATRQGNPIAAIASYRQIVDWLDAAGVFSGSWPRRSIDTIGRTLNGLATIAHILGQRERAARLFGAAAADDRAIGIEPALPERTLFEQARADLRWTLGDDAFNEGWNIGSLMTPAEVRSEITAILTADVPSVMRLPWTAPESELTARERAVLRLLQERRSDKEIGSALFISHRTAMGHVANILRKLGVSSRAAAVQRAEQLGLL